MPTIDKAERQRVLREVLARNTVASQRDLLDLLWADGIETTTATLSRDLREIGAIKDRGGYRVDRTDRDHRRGHKRLAGHLKGLIERLDRGGNLVVIHTTPGRGAAVALEIEGQALPEVMGAIAGADTVFVATRSATHARELERTLTKAVTA